MISIWLENQLTSLRLENTSNLATQPKKYTAPLVQRHNLTNIAPFLRLSRICFTFKTNCRYISYLSRVQVVST